MMVSGHVSPQAVLGTTIAVTILAAVVVGLRLYTRIAIAQSDVGPDDVLILAALTASISLAVNTSLGVQHGLGQHVQYLTPDDGFWVMKTMLGAFVSANIANSCTKFSILVQCWRIFVQAIFRRWCIALAILVGIYALTTFFTTVFICRPLAAFWDQSITDAICLNEEAVWFSHAGMNIMTDLAVAILPLPFLSTLRIPRRQKIALMVVFGLAGFTCIISILRLEALYATTTSQEPNYDNALTALFTAVETNTGIICSSLPILKALFSRFFAKSTTSNQPSQSSGGKYGSRHLNQQSGQSREELGHHLSSYHGAMHTSKIGRGNRPHDSEVLEMTALPKDIQVVTVVQHDFERGLDDSRSDHESTKHLVTR